MVFPGIVLKIWDTAMDLGLVNSLQYGAVLLHASHTGLVLKN